MIFYLIITKLKMDIQIFEPHGTVQPPPSRRTGARERSRTSTSHRRAVRAAALHRAWHRPAVGFNVLVGNYLRSEHCVTQLKLDTVEKLSNPIFCCLSGIGVTRPNLHFFQYIQAYKPFDDPIQYIKA